ncbi:hypothetical protein FKM82_013379 [Ascaphus truei]
MRPEILELQYANPKCALTRQAYTFPIAIDRVPLVHQRGHLQNTYSTLLLECMKRQLTDEKPLVLSVGNFTCRSGNTGASNN